MRARFAALAVLAAACSSSSPAPTGPAPAPAPAAADLPMSDPAEYRIERVTRDAGRTIFARTGLGDPYRVGVPYPIFLAMMRGWPALFGADTAALAARHGFLPRAPDPTSDDRDVREGLPIGLHLTDDPITGVPFVVHNCTLCHAERVRWDGGEALVIGLGNKRVRIHTYDAAFAELARQPDLTVARLATLAESEARARGVPWPYDWREPLVSATIDALQVRARERRELHDRTRDNPPGRIAVIESFAQVLSATLTRPIAAAPHVGWAKIPDTVGFGARTTLSFDGAGEGPMDVLVVEADFAAGVRPAWFWAHPLQGAALSAYLRQPDRAPPFPGPIDRALAARGQERFAFHCGPCHGEYDAGGRAIRYEESIVDLDDIGTDPARALALTDDFVAAANDHSVTAGLTRTRRTGGYVPPVLTRIWARAPYGHAGQWPSLAFLATPPADRAPAYVLQLDALYDLERVGVPTRIPLAPLAPGEHLHEGSAPGASVLGHPFLSDAGPDAAAIIEYLKTL